MRKNNLTVALFSTILLASKSAQTHIDFANKNTKCASNLPFYVCKGLTVFQRILHQESKAQISQKVKGENIWNNWSVCFNLS